MRRFGVAGSKFGNAKQAARRFSIEDVNTVEQRAGVNPLATGEEDAFSKLERRAHESH